VTVLLTGITGRVGSRLAVELLERGHRVRGIAMPDDPLLSRLSGAGDLEIVYRDLRRGDDLADAVKDADAVVHLAAQLVLNGSSPLDLYDINVTGTMRLLEAVKEQERKPRFVLASTDGTYGVIQPRYLPIDERHPQVAGDYYSGSKVLAERLLENYAAQFDLSYAILRFSTIIAPEESLSWFRYGSSLARLRRARLGRLTNLWPLFVDHPDMDELLIEAVADPAGDPAVALLGPTGQPWGMPITDVRDIVRAIVSVLDLEDAPGEAFNVAGPTVTAGEGAKVIAEALEVPLYEVRLPVLWHYEVDTSKARAAFGYEPAWSFERTVRDALTGGRGEPHAGR
jgi:UDP-glucose 4-epimerase